MVNREKLLTLIQSAFHEGGLLLENGALRLLQTVSTPVPCMESCCSWTSQCKLMRLFGGLAQGTLERALRFIRRRWK